MALYLFNSLTRRKEAFQPLKPKEVGLYTCGPTVYNHAHIGNLRTYLFEDVLKRVLAYNAYTVKHVMNITDVGHLTGDRDMGRDKLEEGARREGKSAWEIADFYTRAFQADMTRLNILPPDIWCKATDSIPEQIALIRLLEQKQFTYRTRDGIYFDTARFPDYAKLSHQNLEALQEGARVEVNPEKRNPTDFALWKFSPPRSQRQMEWDSPWGTGFPGWHVECSAMSMKYLGDQLDIHCGGVDHIDVHHTNEIAQSEAATGRRFFNYWMHGAFLVIAGGKKMAKSEGDFLTLENAFIKCGIDPLAFRFAAFQTHYRKPMEYSADAIAGAWNGLQHLRNQVRTLHEGTGGRSGQIQALFQDKFRIEINNDLNMPRAMAVVQELLKAELAPADKLATVFDCDRVLGFELAQALADDALPEEIQRLVEARLQARQARDFAQADALRDALQAKGYLVQDSPTGTKVFKP